jgi:hypothetical protein
MLTWSGFPRSPDLRNPATATIYKGGVVQRDRSYYPGNGLAVADRRVCRSLVARDRFLPRFTDIERSRERTRFRNCGWRARHTPRGRSFQVWSLDELLRLEHSILAPLPQQKA